MSVTNEGEAAAVAVGQVRRLRNPIVAAFSRIAKVSPCKRTRRGAQGDWISEPENSLISDVARATAPYCKTASHPPLLAFAQQ